jgi:hypothetical protein
MLRATQVQTGLRDENGTSKWRKRPLRLLCTIEVEFDRTSGKAHAGEWLRAGRVPGTAVSWVAVTETTARETVGKFVCSSRAQFFTPKKSRPIRGLGVGTFQAPGPLSCIRRASQPTYCQLAQLRTGWIGTQLLETFCKLLHLGPFEELAKLPRFAAGTAPSPIPRAALQLQLCS